MKRKALLTYIKGHNSVVSKRNQPTFNSIPLLPDTNVYAKFEENRSKGTKDRARKWTADGQTYGHSNILGLWATAMLNSHRDVAPKT